MVCRMQRQQADDPEGITKIEEFSFWGYEEGLEEINLPSTLKIIGNSAFSWAKDVKKLVIPEGVTSIGAEALQDWIRWRV